MRILNFGSLNLDYVYQMESFVQPGETKASLAMEKYCGGKGFNQSVALARAGAHVYHAGHIGTDGLVLKDLCESVGVDARYITEIKTATGNAVVQVNQQGENCIILYGGANQEITEKFVDEVLAGFTEEDVLVLQNEINCLEYIINQASNKKMRIALNPSPMNEIITTDMLKKTAWLLLNEIESELITGKEDLKDRMKELRRICPNTAIIMTLGKQGAWYEDANSHYEQGIYDAKVVDTTAAGDTFTGFFLSAFLEKNNVEAALDIATKAATIAVTRKGAYDSIPTLQEVLEYNFRC